MDSLHGTCPTSGQRRARWRGWGGSAAPGEGAGKWLFDDAGIGCGAWAKVFCGGKDTIF